MIQKLQRKFVLVTMFSLFLVLATIIAGINLVNYSNVIRSADELLDVLDTNQGRFPDFEGPMFKLPPGMSPEVPFESRYFTVTTNDAGEITFVDTMRIATVNDQDARSFLLKAQGERGFVKDFRYRKTTNGDSTQFVFLDCGRRMDSFRGFLTASVTISLAGFGLVFLLVLFLSGRIVRPISESYEKQKRFITDAGHELKTPLTIIRADTDILEMESGSNEWLSDIKRQTDRLAALTADLVYLSRMEESAPSLVKIDFALSDVVAETAQSFAALAQTENKQLTLSVAPMLTLRGDEHAITQLVSILLDNAVKYAPAGGNIHLSLEKTTKGIALSVTNTVTEPLDKAQLNRLFDRFYRLNDARNDRGHGIGLSIAQAIVQNHGGRIFAQAPEEHTLRITAIFS